VVSYDRLAVNRQEREAVREFEPDVLILDEAHYLKTRSTKRTTVLYGAHCYGKGIASAAKRVWLLSGTPCPNNAGELWPHFRSLWPELIEVNEKPLTYVSFIQRYCVLQDSPFGPKILGNRNAEELRAILRQIMLRRRAEDVLKDLPPMLWQPVAVEPNDVIPDLTELESDPAVACLKEALTADGVIEGAAVALASLRRVTGLAKANLAGRMIAEELEAKAYEKVVVFFQHLDVGKALISNLSEYGVVSVSGSTTMTQRQNAIDQFQANPAVRVFIGQLQACSTAITLHAANQVVFVEQSWTPSDNAQAAKRCHRIGQSKPVFVRMLGLAKSIDEAVARVLARKSQAISELMEI
jgi:SNF2 family DNA or RNA helicase